MKIYHSKKFAKKYKKLPVEIKLFAERKEELFRKNPFDPSLKTHKLKGELSDYYSFSISYHFRIVFHFEKENIIFDTIGTHEVYK
ncbi:MAG: type II toxin-antitoxin system YafQ family toxin [Candidatus Levybacteria bacterium]|nr:type II toxin-antitoxin system YafQ family toxin [Candidatus Levybacteria bacterium]